MKIERLDESAWQRLRAIRLAALKTDPSAFGSTHDARAAWPEERWREQLRTLPTFVATVDGRDVGMVRSAPTEDEDVAYLISMWVEPKARRRGVGRALVDSVIQWGRDHGKRRIILDVRESNEGAIAMYTAYGFVATGKVECEPPPDEHIRERELGYAIEP